MKRDKIIGKGIPRVKDVIVRQGLSLTWSRRYFWTFGRTKISNTPAVTLTGS